MLFDHNATPIGPYRAPGGAPRFTSKIDGLRRFSTARGACGKIADDGALLAAPRSGQTESRHLTHHGRRAMYQSDITQFLNQLKQQKPNLEAEQRKGRALLWDKQPIDLEERAEQKASRVQQTPYSYYQNF
ncbi:hypothetical protein QF001_007524 [Paraburkholderia youngii]